MYYKSFQTNDHTTIAYQTSIPLPINDDDDVEVQSQDDTVTTNSSTTSTRTCILLLHGFSGSSTYFKRNLPSLSENHWVIAPDMRGHGYSEQTRHGYHVARLAMDLRDLVTKVILAHNPQCQIVAVGCSIGAAVLWTYTELFTDHDFAGLVFVDQAPLQDRSMFDGWGAGLAHYGCYDEATMLEAQKSLSSTDDSVRHETYAGLVASCLGYRYAPSPGDTISQEEQEADERFFVGISRRCNGVWLARLLADHTRYDHREAIELIEKPVLVMAGKRSGCFSVEGMMETKRRAQMNPKRHSAAEGIVFDGGHWLFWEEPEPFNQKLLAFVESCQSADSRALY